MRKYSLLIWMLCGILVFLACERNDDEPIIGERQISRLYVSTSDYDPNGGDNFYNVYVIDPADSNAFPPIDSIYKFRSGAKGGRFLRYTPYNNGVVFQASQNLPGDIDTAIQVMSVSRTGVLGINHRLSTGKFNNVRGIDYSIKAEGDIVGEYLLVLNANSVNDTLYIANNPSRANSRFKPRYELPLNYNSWSVQVVDYDVFVTSFSNANRPSSVNGVMVYKNLIKEFLANKPDTLLSNTNAPRIDLVVKDAQNIRGISYSKVKDLLVLTDFSGQGENASGRILFFDNFSTKTNANGTITADRIITSSGVLKQPLDVAIDVREEGKYIYVADPVAKRVFRYSISDQGEVKPNLELNLAGRAPQSVSLDAR